MDYRDHYIKHGYVIVKKFFEKEYLLSKRNEFLKNSNQQNKEIFDNDFIRELYLNNKFINLIKNILNSNKIVYFSDASIVNHKNMFTTSNGYHNDSREDDCNFNKEYPFLRVATYLQDTLDYSGGVKIKPGSHLYYCFTLRGFINKLKKAIKILLTTKGTFKIRIFNKGIQPDLEVGDLIIWNLRTHHSGTAIKLKFNNKLSLHPIVEKLIPNILKSKTQYPDRLSSFMVFGKEMINDQNFNSYINRKIEKEKKFCKNISFLKEEFNVHKVKYINTKI